MLKRTSTTGKEVDALILKDCFEGLLEDAG